jgi:hypothetical protein
MFRPFFSRIPVEPQPLIDLLTIRSSIPAAPHDSPETIDCPYLSKIPKLEKSKFSRIRTDAEFLSRYSAISFNHTVISDIVEHFDDLRYSRESISVVLLFECFLCLYSKGPHRPTDLLLCQNAFNFVLARSLFGIRNATFRRLLEIILSQSVDADFDLLAVILIHFQTNVALDASFFDLFCHMCRFIMATCDSCLSGKMHEIIYQMIADGMALIDLERISELISLFHPSFTQFDPKSLDILALLSFRVAEEHLLDSFWLINAALGKLLRDQVSPYHFVAKPELTEEVQCDFHMPFEIVKTEFCWTFHEIPYDALTEVHDVMEILDERARLAIDVVGTCLRDCSNDAKETFIRKSLDLFRIVEQDSNMLIIVGAFCGIYEQILDKDLLGLVLPPLSKSRLYSNGDTVFNDESIDLGTNTIRHTIFQLTARLAPELVVLSMDCFAENPLIMTELLSRVLMNLESF